MKEDIKQSAETIINESHLFAHTIQIFREQVIELIKTATKSNMKIYEALHCSCIHEGAWYTISTHRTKKGAKKAIEEHRKGHLPNYESIEELYEYENWKVNESELLD